MTSSAPARGTPGRMLGKCLRDMTSLFEAGCFGYVDEQLSGFVRVASMDCRRVQQHGHRPRLDVLDGRQFLLLGLCVLGVTVSGE